MCSFWIINHPFPFPTLSPNHILFRLTNKINSLKIIISFKYWNNSSVNIHKILRNNLISQILNNFSLRKKRFNHWLFGQRSERAILILKITSDLLLLLCILHRKSYILVLFKWKLFIFRCNLIIRLFVYSF